MSRPPSASSSTLPSRPDTPKRQSSLPPARKIPLPEREHTTTFSHKFRHMFETAKTANFHTTVIIHELGNVPQLAGDFAVSWKFRGRRPKGKPLSPQELSNKPSLPNLKIGSVTTVHSNPSSSSISIKSTSTGSSPRTSTYPASVHSLPPPGRNIPAVPKSASLPPPHPTPIAGTSRLPPHSRTSPSRPKKKASDPTPLKQSIIPLESPISESPTSDSRPILEVLESSPEPSPELLHPDRARDLSEGSSETAPTRNVLNLSLSSSAASSTSRLSVPVPRPAARSGTVPLVANPPDPVAGSSDSTLSRIRDTRSPSSSSLRPDAASNASAPSLPRRRTSSGLSPSHSSLNLKANARKGTTPVRALKAHTCTWDYEIQHTMKIPLGKPIPISGPGNATPRFKGTAPVVGAGPLSESGLRLVIEQYPSKAATAGPRALDQDKEGLGGVLQEARIHHHDKHHSEKGRSSTKTHKTVFGTVDVDLAAFAGKGRMTRRFLLVGSRTNATIKLSVDMRWIGGEEKWAAPPMQEGHHVTGVRDLLGDDVKSDLNLAKTTSNTSSSSSLSAPSRSDPSAASSVRLAASMSNASLVPPAPQLAYKTYEHHLKPPSPAAEPSSAADIFRRHTHHRHRSHHSRHFRNPPAIQQFSMHDLSPDVVIETIFNPHPSNEEGPFTYIPSTSNEELQSSDAVVETLWRDLQENEGAPAPEPKEVKHGWGLRGMKGRREKRAMSTTVA